MGNVQKPYQIDCIISLGIINQSVKLFQCVTERDNRPTIVLPSA